MRSFAWLLLAALGLALIEASPLTLRQAASTADHPGVSTFLDQFMAAGSLPSKPGAESAADKPSSEAEPEAPSSDDDYERKIGYGEDDDKHSSHHDGYGGDGYDSHDDGYDSHDDGYDSDDDYYDDDDHYSGGYGHHEEKEEEPYFQAALDCRFRVFPYVTKPEECSEVKVKDYEPDFLFDSPSKKEAKGHCYWDFHRAKVDSGGACLCPRPKKECKEKKKQCFWHTYPNVGKIHDDKDKKSGYYGSSKHDKHEDKSSGVCIHNSERFYNLMAKLLAKRGKKDLSLQIHYSSAPARGKLPYGPHGPAIIGYGKDFEQQHGYGYRPEYYREQQSGYGNDHHGGYGGDLYGYGNDHHGYGNNLHFGYGNDHHGYGNAHHGYEDDHHGYEDDHHGYGDDHHGYGNHHFGYADSHFGFRRPAYPYAYDDERYLPNPYSFEHIAAMDAARYHYALPSYNNAQYPSHGYDEDNEYGFEPTSYPAPVSYNNHHQSQYQVHDYPHPPQYQTTGLPIMSGPEYYHLPGQVDSYFPEPEVQLGSYHSEPSPYDWLPASHPWATMPIHGDPYHPQMLHHQYMMPSHHQCPPPAQVPAASTHDYTAGQQPAPPTTDSYATAGQPAAAHNTGAYAAAAPPAAQQSYDTAPPVAAASTPYKQQSQPAYSATPPPPSNHQYKAPLPASPAPSAIGSHPPAQYQHQPSHGAYQQQQPKPEPGYHQPPTTNHASMSPQRYAPEPNYSVYQS